MSKKSRYLAQDYIRGRWVTIQAFDTEHGAWSFAACLPKGRVIFRGRTMERPEGLGEGTEDGRSIVKRAYRIRYQYHQDTNGDPVAEQLKNYLHDETKDGLPCINRTKMERFAQANELWDPRYSRLNNGQVRMNIGNKLRARMRKNPKHELNWPEIM